MFALDAKGYPLSGLTLEDLNLKEDGHVQKIAAISKVTEPESICILVDSSGSMYQRVAGAKEAVTRLVNALPPEDEVCVADFSFAAYIDQRLTTDRTAVIDSLKFLKASGGTALYDSVIALATYMRQSSRYLSRSIVLISDGDDNASRHDEDAMLRELKTSGSPVVDFFRLPSTRANSNRPTERAALDAARVGGGLSYFPFPDDARELNAVMDSLVAALSSRYEVKYQPDRSVADGRKRRLTVNLAKNRQISKAEIRAPEEYYAPSQ
jgi:VWFA-related protein